MFLYANNELAGRGIKETVPFTVATKRSKHLGINLTKKVKDLCSENDIILCSWIGRMNIVKMSILPIEILMGVGLFSLRENLGQH